jgi:hypothetical protein
MIRVDVARVGRCRFFDGCRRLADSVARSGFHNFAPRQHLVTSNSMMKMQSLCRPAGVLAFCLFGWMSGEQPRTRLAQNTL